MPEAKTGRNGGFTLMEVLVAVALIAIVAAVMGMSFGNLRDTRRARDAMRALVSVISEAQGAALMLGSASGTTRVTSLNCPPEFSESAGVWRGRAALVVDTTAGANRLTYVTRVVRTNDVLPATYDLECSTVDFSRTYRGAISIEGAPETMLEQSGANLYVAAFDGRGIVSNLPGRIAAISTIESGGETLRRRQRVLLLSSGFSCLEGEPETCLADR